MKQFFKAFAFFSLLIYLIPSLVLLNANASGKKPNVEDENPLLLSKVKILDTKTESVFEYSLRDYIIAAVLANIDDNFCDEAIKVQAIISHTYILSCHLSEIQNPTPALKGADISNNFTKYLNFYTPDQAKIELKDNYNQILTKISTIVDEVIKFVCVYDKKPIFPYFHLSSSGKTESSKEILGLDYPYLKSVSSAYDETSEYFGFEKELTFLEVKARLSQALGDIDLSDNFDNMINLIDVSDGGFVNRVLIDSKREMSGIEISRVLNLNSACFTFEINDSSFTFKTYGKGNLVGLSQFGANEMAKEGKTFEEILKHYYSGIDIVSIT